MNTEDVRLRRRQWILDHFDALLIQSIYHRVHKEEFALPKQVLWKLDDEEGVVQL